jgi:hypothetical protein
MYQLLVAIFIMTSGLSYSQTYNRCGMPTGHACSEFPSRLEAFKKLRQNENDHQQALDNMTLVETVQKNFNLNLEYTVDNFIYLQIALGGVNGTDATRDAFNYLTQFLNINNYSLHNLITYYVHAIKMENDNAQAHQNFDLIIKSVSGQIHLEVSNYMFYAILETEGGNNYTDDARDSFRRLLEASQYFAVNDLLDSWKSMVRAENDRQQAVTNQMLVYRAGKKCGSLTVATNDFLEVLKQVGGSNYTDIAQDLYKRLYDL